MPRKFLTPRIIMLKALPGVPSVGRTNTPASPAPMKRSSIFYAVSSGARFPFFGDRTVLDVVPPAPGLPSETSYVASFGVCAWDPVPANNIQTVAVQNAAIRRNVRVSEWLICFIQFVV